MAWVAEMRRKGLNGYGLESFYDFKFVTEDLSKISRCKRWRLLKWLGSLPFLSTLLLVIFLQVVGEQFPFSPFPMYTGFGGEASVLYATDGKGEKLSFGTYFRIRSAKLSKVFNTELKRVREEWGVKRGRVSEEEVGEAGQRTVIFLASQKKDGAVEKLEGYGLRLHRITLLMDEKGFSRRERVIGEVP